MPERAYRVREPDGRAGHEGLTAAPLPELVRRHAERSLPGGPAPRQLRLAQAGEMQLRPGGRPLRFTATETFAVDRVAFAWRARFPLAGPLALHVLDGYAGGEGALEVRVLGIPVQRQRGPQIARGEALRYLAELPWVPWALAENAELEWREVDERRVEVAALVAGERLAVQLEVDDAGDVVRASSAMRRRKVGKTWRETPWGGEFGDYDTVGGVRIPASGAAYWELPEGRYVYWRGRVTSAEPLEQPFAA